MMIYDGITLPGRSRLGASQTSEQLQAEHDLPTHEEFLRLSQEAAGVGCWEYRFASNRLIWSEQTKRLLEVEPDEPSPFDHLLSRIHGEDRARIEEHVARCLNRNSDHSHHIEFRIRTRRGALRWLEVQGRVDTNAAGAPDRALGILSDITVRKNAEEVHERLAAIVASSTDAIISQSLDGTVTSWNEAAEHIFGYSHGEMIGQSIRRLIPADQQPKEGMILASIARGERIENYETVSVCESGRLIEVLVTTSPVRDDTGRIIGASKIFRDITARKQAGKLLRYQADLLDQSHEAIFVWKIGGNIVRWSKGAERLYGYTAEEAVGQNGHTLLVTQSPVSMQEVETRVVREGSWYGELAHTTLDGRKIVVESRIVRVSNDGGRDIYALEINRDITERKAHDEHAQLLLNEVNHRAKNLLSLVDAIARRTAIKGSKDFVERFSARIQALSANQDLLVRNDWRGVDVDDLVRGQLAHFAELIGSRIDVRGPKLHLKANATQALGLALHELATNASKYGALSTDGGRVDVCWATSGDNFSMSWTERGGPSVSAPKRRGFGTTVIEQMAGLSLEGTVDLDYAPSGLTWRLTCPADRTLEPRDRSSSLSDRTLLEKRSSVARRHVATGERNIARQREIIAGLERDGHDSQEAKWLLTLFEELQNMHIAHRDRLRKALGENPI